MSEPTEREHLEGLDRRGELDGVDHSPSPREIENAERIRLARSYADKARAARSAEDRAAWAALGMLEIAIVRADVRSYEPPF